MKILFMGSSPLTFKIRSLVYLTVVDFLLFNVLYTKLTQHSFFINTVVPFIQRANSERNLQFLFEEFILGLKVAFALWLALMIILGVFYWLEKPWALLVNQINQILRIVLILASTFALMEKEYGFLLLVGIGLMIYNLAGNHYILKRNSE